MVVSLAGFESVQGRRTTMEDAHIVLEDVNQPFNLQGPTHRAYYGVYDGHGGTLAADMTADLLHRNIILDPSFGSGNIEEAIKSGFDKTDKTILEKADKERWSHGTTTVVGMIIDNTLYIANTGDSEAVLAQQKDGEEGLESILLTEKHKPNAPEEKKRIEAAGGQVVFGRVLGSLAVSRALGDMDFKYPFNKAEGHFVSGEPFIQKLELTPKNPFLVIACDGLWDKVTYEEAIEFIAKAKAEGKDPTETSQLLTKHSLDQGSFDNVTIIVIYLHWNS